MAANAPTFRLVSSRRRAWLTTLRASIESVYRNRLHTHFTDHSIVHCDRVASLAEKLLIPLKGKPRKLNDDEATILYGSCYLHDIGMHNERAGELGRMAEKLQGAGRSWDEVPQEERLDLIRRSHHEISADMVLQSVASGSPLIGFTLQETDHPAEIAAISEAHCVDTASPRYDELTSKGERSTLRLRLVSAILRLSDILDEAHHRALVQQARTLDLNLESRMHWWRHHFTREIEVEPEKNRITIWFGFPIGKRDEYEKVIPALQMPWLEQELARHRAVLAENGLSWHIGWQIQERAFETLEPMPPEVESAMLQELARRKHVAAQQSRVDLLKHFDQSREHLMQQLHDAQSRAESSDPSEYLDLALRLTTDLWDIGSRLTAWTSLSSVLFFTTHNGRSVPAELRIQATTRLAWMQMYDRQPRSAMITLSEIGQAVAQLDDLLSEKANYYRLRAKIAFDAGYYDEGCEYAREAMRLFGTSASREEVAAELAEATLLEGRSTSHPTSTQ